MAIVEVKVPQLSESVAEATMLTWKKKAGEAVAVDEILIEIETDKVAVEVSAPADGVLTITAEAGSTVTPGATLGSIAASGAAAVDTVGVVLRVHLPGDVGDTTGQVTALAPDATDGTDASGSESGEASSVVDWPIAMDGSDTVITATSEKSLERGGAWPVLATV
eukprot:gene19396-38714_t